MRTALTALVAIAAALFAAGDTEFRLDTAFGGRVHDAEKSRSNKEDDYLCWAAPAANILAWTGWGDTGKFKDEDAIFRYFSEHWTDDPAGSPHVAWYWWFKGVDPLPGKGAEVDVPGGGFYREREFPKETWTNRRGSLYRGVGCKVLERDPLALKKLLDEGYGVAIQIVRPLPDGKRDSHMITLWGYRSDAKNPFVGILITDSDDDKQHADAKSAKNDLRYFPVTLRDKMWWFTYNEQEWQILAAYALARRPGYPKAEEEQMQEKQVEPKKPSGDA